MTLVRQYSSAGDSVSIVSGGLVADINNSTAATLAADATYTGTATDVLAYNQIHVTLKMSPNVVPDEDANTAQGSLYVEFSPDATNWDISIPLICRSGIFIPQVYVVVDRYFRVRYINDGGAAAIASLGTGEVADTARNQTAFRLNSRLVRTGTVALGANTGAVDVETSGGTLMGRLLANTGSMARAQYAVPLAKTAYLRRIRVTPEGSKNVTFRLWTRKSYDDTSAPMPSKMLRAEWVLISETQGFELTHPFKLEAKEEIWVSANTGTGTSAASCAFELLVVDD